MGGDRCSSWGEKGEDGEGENSGDCFSSSSSGNGGKANFEVLAKILALLVPVVVAVVVVVVVERKVESVSLAGDSMKAGCMLVGVEAEMSSSFDEANEGGCSRCRSFVWLLAVRL